MSSAIVNVAQDVDEDWVLEVSTIDLRGRVLHSHSTGAHLVLAHC